MSTVAFCVHHEHPEVAALAAAAHAWLVANGHRCVVVADGDSPATNGVLEVTSGVPADAALVVTLGGDGTMLRAVRHLDGADVPLLGVNLGQLGYLTEVDPGDLITALAAFFGGADAGGWHLEARMMLTATILRGHARLGSWRALNEAVIEKSQAGHTIRLLATIDGVPFTSYAADGMIVATPTGSTAYSLSARGPVVSPRHRALLLTPVAPHMLFDRTLVLDPSEVVELEVLGHRRAELAVDGLPVHALDPGDVVRVAPAAECAHFVRFRSDHYHQILKSKFGLADR